MNPPRFSIRVLNHQRLPVNTPLLKRLVHAVLVDLFPGRPGAVGVHLVSPRRMAHLNHEFLGHEGPTDVITFDHAGAGPSPDHLYGELFVCPEVAKAQAETYQTTWQRELARHVVHGLLHLAGEDDTQKTARKAMKRKEDRWLVRLQHRFPLSQLSTGSRLRLRCGQAGARSADGR